MILLKKLDRLMADFGSGRLKFTEGVNDQIVRDIDKIERLSNGEIDLSSCSSELRSFARAYFLAATVRDDSSELDDVSIEQKAIPPAIDLGHARQLNRVLFAHFAEVFRSLTGCLPDQFVIEGGEFSAEIRKLGGNMRANPGFAQRRMTEFHEAVNNLDRHYKESKNQRASLSAAYPGQKMVLGGGQSFSNSSLQAVRSMLLYTDTVLIPDPVHRWFEKEHETERFPRVRMLEDIFHLYQLRPLVDEDLPSVPIIMFPSWEKLMEEHDQETKEGQESLVLSVMSYALRASLEDLQELTDYIAQHPVRFLECMEKNRLFVAWGGSPDDPMRDAIKRQRSEWALIRSPDFVKELDSWDDARVVALSIMERLGPQYHVLENALSLDASPLFALPVQWHYFDVCYNMRAKQLEAAGQLSAKTIKMVKSFSQEDMAWLGQIAVEDLVRLRGEMANINFRKSIGSIMGDLESCSPQKIDYSLSNAVTAMQKLLVEHDQELIKLDEEYRRKNVQTLTGLTISLGAAFLPWLPVVGAVAATAAATKFAVDAVEQKMKRGQMSKTMMGVLAASARGKK